MTYMMYLMLFILILGLVGVSSNPSPGFAALSLVMVAGGGCGVLASQGGYFLSLVLFLIYLGGMLVVFAYSVAFSGSINPEGWGSRSIFMTGGGYLLGTMGWAIISVEGWAEGFWAVGAGFNEFSVIQESMMGIAFLYLEGGGFLVIGAWTLLLVLLVVLKLVRGTSWGAIRVV